MFEKKNVINNVQLCKYIRIHLSKDLPMSWDMFFSNPLFDTPKNLPLRGVVPAVIYGNGDFTGCSFQPVTAYIGYIYII